MLCKRGNRNFIFVSLIFSTLLCAGIQAAPFDLRKEAQKFLAGGEVKGIFSPIDARKDQLEKLQKRVEELKGEAREVASSYKKRVAAVKAALAKSQGLKAQATGEEADYFGKEIALQNERKQHLVVWRDARIESPDIVASQAKTAEGIIVELTRRMEGEREVQFFYSLRDLRDVQTKIASHIEQVRGERLKRENLGKARRGEEEDLVSVQKAIIDTQAELKLAQESPHNAKKSAEVERESDLLKLRLTMLSERKEAVDAALARLELDLAFRKDKTSLLELKLGRYKKRHALIQSRLNVSQGDVAAAKKEVEAEKKRVAGEINALSREQESKKSAKRREKNDLDGIETELKVIVDEKKEEEPVGRLVVAH